jgi:hypothetical protein
VSTGRSIHAVPSITPSLREGIEDGPRLRADRLGRRAPPRRLPDEDLLALVQCDAFEGPNGQLVSLGQIADERSDDILDRGIELGLAGGIDPCRIERLLAVVRHGDEAAAVLAQKPPRWRRTWPSSKSGAEETRSIDWTKAGWGAQGYELHRASTACPKPSIAKAGLI